MMHLWRRFVAMPANLHATTDPHSFAPQLRRRTDIEAQATKQPEATVESQKPPEFIESRWILVYKFFTEQVRDGKLTL